MERYPVGRHFWRKPRALFGDGLLETVPSNEILQIATAELSDHPRHAGRIPYLRHGIGRFGWKADFATISGFVTEAMTEEIGVKKPRAVQELAHFVRSLAAPPFRGESTSSRGYSIFLSIGCADCHRPSLTTGYYALRPPLSRIDIHAYTDLLLHRMGSRDGDLPGYVARADEFMTPPLWGLASTGPPYMHDGSASSTSDAILRHNGQASDSAKTFERLSEDDKTALESFLQSL